MHDARSTILEWWKLVRPGGFLFILVPDEDLYEQGVFPSRFNPDHKATFTISKAKSWSPKSVNVLGLACSLPGGEIVSLQLQDVGYDRRLQGFGQKSANLVSRALAKIYGWLAKWMDVTSLIPYRQFLSTYYPVDQTLEPYNAQAQIQLIVKKTF